MLSDYSSSLFDVNNVLRYCCHLVTKLLDFPENLLSVEQVGDKDPTRSSHKVLGEVLSVGLVVSHAPAEGEVFLKHFMAHIHKDGVHTWSHESESRVEKFKYNSQLVSFKIELLILQVMIFNYIYKKTLPPHMY